MQTIADYIIEKGLEFRRQSGQLVVKKCPFCMDEKWHLYIGLKEGGPFFCHKCNQKGNLYSLKKHLGDISPIRPAFSTPQFKKPTGDRAKQHHKALLNDSGAMQYLLSRGINSETIDRFRLGIDIWKNVKFLSIPHYQNGKLINIKYRSLPPAKKTFRRIPGCKSILFNSDALKGQSNIFITEGELDAITMAQIGIENVISGTTGAGSFDPEWIDQLSAIKKVYLVYDADPKGQEGARSVAKRLGYNRCFNVELPEGQDPNDYFTSGHDIFDFQKRVQNARKFDLPGVISVDTAMDLLQREKNAGDDTGLITPWQNVNSLVKGFKPGDLIVLSAPPKTGKTSWALDISRMLTCQNTPVLFFCMEMRPERVVHKLIQSHYRQADISSRQLEKARKELSGVPLYLAHTFKKHQIEAVLSLIREAIKRYDLKFVVFDNLHFLIRSLSNVNEELGQAVQHFKLLAEEMEIPVMAIAQPRKRDPSRPDAIMCAEDIKYSNAIHADCDQMIILHRNRIASKARDIDPKGFTAKNESLDPITLVRVEAHRYGSGGETLLYFHGEYSRFDLVEKQDSNEHWTDKYG